VSATPDDVLVGFGSYDFGADPRQTTFTSGTTRTAMSKRSTRAWWSMREIGTSN
jgi:hypothetical protein